MKNQPNPAKRSANPGASGPLRGIPNRRPRHPADHPESKRILVTGASGFIAGYLIAELLDAGYEVIGLDNFSKYGHVRKSYDAHCRYRFLEGDAKDGRLLKSVLETCDHFVAGAAISEGFPTSTPSPTICSGKRTDHGCKF